VDDHPVVGQRGVGLDLEALAGIMVEATCIGRDTEVGEGGDELLLLVQSEARPCGPTIRRIVSGRSKARRIIGASCQ
jgi:hypothetical protein